MKQLSSSELITNPDGSIYHLNLKPEDIAQTIITVGDPDRVEEVSKHFDSIEIKKQKREFVTHTGQLNGKRITVISTGISTDNIDIVINELDALVNIDLENRTIKEEKTQLDIIRIGTSGSMQKDIPVDSFLISDFALGLDGLMYFYDFDSEGFELDLTLEFVSYFNELIDLKITPYVFGANPALIKKVGKGMQHGVTVTCGGFYAPQGRTLRAKAIIDEQFFAAASAFNYGGWQMTNFEMETAGIYGLAHILGHRAVSCNAILANRVTGEFSEKPKKVVGELIERVLEGVV